MSIRFSNPLRPRAMLAAMASLASTVCAAGAAPVAVAPKSGELVNVPQVMLSLVLVLGALFALAWFARRLRGFRRGNGPQITVLSELVLGPKERALLLQVEEQLLLLPQHPVVSLLCLLDPMLILFELLGVIEMDM